MALSDLSKNWNKLAVFAAGIVGSLAGFLVMPPTDPTSSSWKQFSVFFVSLIVGLWLVPVNRWSTQRQTNRWWLVAVASVLLGLVASLSYNIILDKWAPVYWREQRMVIGTTKTPFAEDFARKLAAQHQPSDDLTVLQKFQGRNRDVWRGEEISARELKLELLYIATVFILTSALVAVTQALYCSTQGGKLPD